MSEKPEPQLKILEAMSLIYEVCMKRKEYSIPQDSDFYSALLRNYNSLQQLRDDTIFMSVEADLSDKALKKQKQSRIDELLAPPFNATKGAWMK